MESVFSDPVFIEESKRYTFAIFGKNGTKKIDPRPMTSIMLEATPTPPTSGELLHLLDIFFDTINM